MAILVDIRIIIDCIIRSTRIIIIARIIAALFLSFRIIFSIIIIIARGGRIRVRGHGFSQRWQFQWFLELEFAIARYRG